MQKQQSWVTINACSVHGHTMLRMPDDVQSGFQIRKQAEIIPVMVRQKGQMRYGNRMEG